MRKKIRKRRKKDGKTFKRWEKDRKKGENPCENISQPQKQINTYRSEMVL